MPRFISGCLVVALATAGVAPCVMPRAAGAMMNHDCCDPDQMDVGRPADTAAARLMSGPPACCAASTAAQAPAAAFVASAADGQRIDALPAAAPVVALDPAALPRLTTRDLRSRSAPRPPLIPALLI
jgi:hypothetical protein